MIQEIIDEAVRIATRQALNGKPVSLIWIPPQNATDSKLGYFAIVEYPPVNSSEAAPW